jgi:hypothetical protein
MMNAMDSIPEDSGRIGAVDPAVLAALPSPHGTTAPNTCPFADLCPWQTWNRPPEPPEPQDELSWRSSATRRKAPPVPLVLKPLNHEELDRVRDAELVDGRTLARLRRIRGVDLETICDRTKISMMILRFIEQDRHEDLPATIYLRGYLEQVRSLLGLPAFVIERYLDDLPDEGEFDGSTVRIRRR